MEFEPAANAECLFECYGRGIDLYTLLHHREALSLFELYLRAAYNEESLLFWIAVDNYEKEYAGSKQFLPLEDQMKLQLIEHQLATETQTTERIRLVLSDGNLVTSGDTLKAALLVTLWEQRRAALDIMEKFLTVGSAQCLNISASLRSKISDAVRKYDLSAGLFDDAKAECFRLILNNDFEPFKESGIFQDLLKKRSDFDGHSYARNQGESKGPVLRRASTGSSAGPSGNGDGETRRVSMGT